MTTRYKIYACLAIVIAAGFLIAHLTAQYRLSKLERGVDESRTLAQESEQRAARAEIAATEYKQKTDYLEQQLAGLETKRKEQDETILRTKTRTDDSRDRLERARRTRASDATAAELCTKLAELGHACE